MPISNLRRLRSTIVTIILGLALFGASQAYGSASDAVNLYLPIITKPVANIKSLVSSTTLTLPAALGPEDFSWCTWGWCHISPRLYHEPLSDGRTLIGWTDSGGNGHVSVLNTAGTSITTTYDFTARSIRGLVAHSDGKFAVLLWDADQEEMWLSKRNSDGSQVWLTPIDGPLTVFDPTIGDSRLSYGNGKYMAYFAVYGKSGWVQGHNGDQLAYINDSGVVQSGGWEWGCSHSMAELASYHPALDKFLPVCSSDCYASKGILLNDSKVVYSGDGNCGGSVSTQLGQVALSATQWKLVFSALDRPAADAHGIALATIDNSLGSSYLWLTNTNGEYEREPIIARIGTSLNSNRYLVGWMTTNDSVYFLGVIDGSGNFLMGPENVSSSGIRWGDRDDSLRTRADGLISWVQVDPGSATLRYYRFDGAYFIP